ISGNSCNIQNSLQSVCMASTSIISSLESSTQNTTLGSSTLTLGANNVANSFINGIFLLPNILSNVTHTTFINVIGNTFGESSYTNFMNLQNSIFTGSTYELSSVQNSINLTSTGTNSNV